MVRVPEHIDPITLHGDPTNQVEQCFMLKLTFEFFDTI